MSLPTPVRNRTNIKIPMIYHKVKPCFSLFAFPLFQSPQYGPRGCGVYNIQAHNNACKQYTALQLKNPIKPLDTSTSTTKERGA